MTKKIEDCCSLSGVHWGNLSAAKSARLWVTLQVTTTFLDMPRMRLRNAMRLGDWESQRDWCIVWRHAGSERLLRLA